MDTAESSLARLALGFSAAQSGGAAIRSAEKVACFHCGEPCPEGSYSRGERSFCCQGCLVVHDLLRESNLDQFYSLSRHPGVKIGERSPPQKWVFLDDPLLQQQLLDFSDGTVSRVTFQIPAIHCVACVWLLENLFRLHPGIGPTQVNFPRKEALITFTPGQIRLSELVALLASIGYEPRLTLNELSKARRDPWRQRQWLQVGVAGFAFGNIMLFTLPAYLGLDSLSGPLFRALFGHLSLALALPVIAYSASDYWRSALLSLRQRMLTLDVPITLGMVALYLQSASEIISRRGEGYLDSLAGLVFFLLCGRVFQQKTQDRIVFDRDYRSFFPLSVTRKNGSEAHSVAISNLHVGDRLLLRNHEIIPADARLLSDRAAIDYSFVTGESEPVERKAGEFLYAGGQQVGEMIEIEILKPVSQSYLASLWSHEAFRKTRIDHLSTLTNRYSRRFTQVVVILAVLAALVWLAQGDVTRGIKAFTSVLIVACPCALALAAPFTLGTAQRLLARIQVFLKNAHVLERLAEVDAIVFDKTGTLTVASGNTVEFSNQPRGLSLSQTEQGWVQALARNSLHPHAVRIATFLSNESPGRRASEIKSYAEFPGRGIRARVEQHELRLGSKAWLVDSGIPVPELPTVSGSVSCLAIDGQFRGTFVFVSSFRTETEQCLAKLSRTHELTLLTGDNERERARFEGLFGGNHRMHFNQTPADKLGFIKSLQDNGKIVMMVGDGLNDAGALKQSDVGVAVVEKAGAFSPASDVILEVRHVPQLARILKLARHSVRIVRLSFAISAVYNLVGISVAAAGLLSPVFCAILMPVSSFSVTLFACATTAFAVRRVGLSGRDPESNPLVLGP